MGVLESELFTDPENRELERCATNDRFHITPGTVGEHVRLIQIALNRLLPATFLSVDGIYGPATARAVVIFKERQSPPLRQSFQTVADNIVGIRTIRALDEQISDQEDADDDPSTQGLIALEHEGFPTDHDHEHLCVPFLDAGTYRDKKTQKLLITHKGTPINPQGGGRMLCIGGTNEAKYLRFENCVPDPARDSSMGQDPQGRLLLHTLPAHCASDICMRSAPLDPYVVLEIRRLAKLGCRFTYSSDQAMIANSMVTLMSFGPQLQADFIQDDRDSLPTGKDNLAVVFKIMNIRGDTETPAFHRQTPYPPRDFVP